MAKKKVSPADEAAKIKAEIDALKEKAKILDAKPKKSKKTVKKTVDKPIQKTIKKGEKKSSKKPTKKEGSSDKVV